MVPYRNVLFYWLMTVTFLIIMMVFIGGLTRLTDSGLSITSWKPLSGAIPPLSLEDWQKEFTAYQMIPQYKQLNVGMSLEEFKSIFWWEWGHRQLGRLIGLVYFIPFMIFLLKGMIPPSWKKPLWFLFFLGGLQGFVGWFMVRSGLSELTSVSHFRLALHLGMALLILVCTFWTALRIRKDQTFQLPAFNIYTGLGCFIFLQIIWGALVAGLDAGHIYNDFPLIDGKVIPFEVFSLSLNEFFHSHLALQFIHRLFGYGLGLYAICMCWCLWKQKAYKFTLWFPAFAIFVQILLGIATLITVAPVNHVWLASLHQIMAVFVLMSTIFTLDQRPNIEDRNRSEIALPL